MTKVGGKRNMKADLRRKSTSDEATPVKYTPKCRRASSTTITIKTTVKFFSNNENQPSVVMNTPNIKITVLHKKIPRNNQITVEILQISTTIFLFSIILFECLKFIKIF
jgi:hypothetical protein